MVVNPNELIQDYIDSGMTREEAIAETKEELKERKILAELADIKTSNDYRMKTERERFSRKSFR